MRIRNLLTATAAAGLLAGCGMTSAVEAVATSVIDAVATPLEAVASPAPAEPEGDRLDAIAFAGAYCKGDAASALAATREAVQRQPQSPRAQLIHGMALDLSGDGVAAYRTLEPLAAARHSMPAVLKCGDEFVYSGTVTEVAQRRLFEIGTELKKLGLLLPLPTQAQTGAALKSMFVFAATAPTRLAEAPLPPQEVRKAEIVPPKPPAENGIPTPMRKPSVKPAGGGLFVHLGSYRSKKMLDKGWQSLKKRYGKLLASERMTVTRVDLGKKKGKYLRLGVEVASRKSAAQLCGKLKSTGQYCAVLKSGRG